MIFNFQYKQFKLVLLFAFCLSLTIFSSEAGAKAKKQIKTGKDPEAKTEEKKKKKEINESEFEPLLLGSLLDKPKDYVGRKIKIKGKFSSFTTLALDYEPALRKSKDYISICLFRPDSMIPLSELKLAYPVKDAKEDEVIHDLDEGDLIEINGQVFSSAFDEPWVDIVSIKMIEKSNKKTLGDKEDKKIEEPKKPKEQGKNNKKTKSEKTINKEIKGE